MRAMSRPLAADAALRYVADGQAGLITAAQLAELGVSSRTISRRVAGGMWTRVLPGVHLVHGGQPTRLQREWAALLYAGDRSLLTGLTALRRDGVRALRLQETAADEAERPEPVHVLIPHGRRRISSGFVVTERTHRLPDLGRMNQGVAMASVARAVADACRRLRSVSDTTALVSEVVHRGLATVDDLKVELDAGQRRGSAFYRDALAAVGAGARSSSEADLITMLDEAGFTSIVVNPTLLTPQGAYIAIPDVWLDDVGLALEVDSVEYHSQGDGFRDTVRRNARYAAAGVPVTTVLPTDIRDRPTTVLDAIRRAHAAAAARPRAQVRLVGGGTPTAGRRAWRWGA
jgi:hypothetical protein